jgi:hypothetical protein
MLQKRSKLLSIFDNELGYELLGLIKSLTNCQLTLKAIIKVINSKKLFFLFVHMSVN